MVAKPKQAKLLSREGMAGQGRARCSLEALYATHLLATGPPCRFLVMDPRPEDMLTTTLDFFFRSSGRKLIVVK